MDSEPGCSKDSECETWDESCTIVDIRLEPEKHLTGYHLMPTCDPNPEPPTKQHKLSLELNQTLLSQEFIDNFKENWASGNVIKEKSAELIVDPFKVCIVPNLLDDKTIITKVIEEFYELNWNQRSLDLYEFFQSVDLKNLTSKHVGLVYEFLKTDVKDWIERLTGLELTNTSATCSLYGDTDYLLLHDDQREDRLIAFVLYFTSPREWKECNGGALQLFSKDDTGQPDKPVRDILPSNNQFVFFQVTNDSYHQVTEVMNKNDCRMSINGWFHTKIPPVFTPPAYSPLPDGLFGTQPIEPDASEIDLHEWIQTDYLDLNNTQLIQDHIEEQSEISLHNYFIPEVFLKVRDQLSCKSIEWSQVGPPNRCNYQVAIRESLPEPTQKFLSLFSSVRMYDLLKRYTDLDLTSMRFELQRWKPGCYSLLSDYDWSEKNELDLILFLNCPRDEDIVGGQIMYVATEEETQKALITVTPDENNLNVVYRDTARISKYVSKYSTCVDYFVLICSYTE